MTERCCPLCGQPTDEERLIDEINHRLRVLRAAVAFRQTLARIADTESGVFGRWARDTLDAHPEIGRRP